MKTPSKEEIELQSAKEYKSIDQSQLGATIMYAEREAYIKGAEWMQEQLKHTDIPQSADVMTFSADDVLDKHVVSHDRGRGMVIMADTFKVSVINAMDAYALQFKWQLYKKEAELTDCKEGLKQCQADRDELHKELEQVKAERDILRVSLQRILSVDKKSVSGDNKEMRLIANKALQSTKQ